MNLFENIVEGDSAETLMPSREFLELLKREF